jgi:hypothetical protein
MSQSKAPIQASHKNPIPVSLGHRLDRKLLAYAAAATAARVGLMALAQPSQAEIVYTKTHVTVKYGGSIAIDLNNDGITDFTVSSSNGTCSDSPFCKLHFLKVSPNKSNSVWMDGGNLWAYALPLGAKVERGDNFAPYALMDKCKATQTSAYTSGSWTDVKNRYLGLAFSIDGKTHYGWARLSTTIASDCRASITLTGYAYQTTPGTPIRTGSRGKDDASEAERAEPTLGILALGGIGLVAWRRDEETDGR